MVGVCKIQRLMYYRLYDLPVVEEEGVTVSMLRRIHQVHDRRTSEIVNDEASIPAIVLSINLFKLLKIAGIAGFCQDCDHSEGGMIWSEAIMFPDQKPSNVTVKSRIPSPDSSKDRRDNECRGKVR
jgi:hypothetical protein